jgi:hypothetical protein
MQGLEVDCILIVVREQRGFIKNIIDNIGGRYRKNIQRLYFAESHNQAETTFFSGKVAVVLWINIAVVEQPYRVIASNIDLAAFDMSIVSENHTNAFIYNYMQISYHILGILNSKLIDFYFRLFNSNTQFSSTELNQLPIIKPNKEQLNTIKAVVQKICYQKKTTRRPIRLGLGVS